MHKVTARKFFCVDFAYAWETLQQMPHDCARPISADSSADMTACDPPKPDRLIRP